MKLCHNCAYLRSAGCGATAYKRSPVSGRILYSLSLTEARSLETECGAEGKNFVKSRFWFGFGADPNIHPAEGALYHED